MPEREQVIMSAELLAGHLVQRACVDWMKTPVTG